MDQNPHDKQRAYIQHLCQTNRNPNLSDAASSGGAP